jgi:hypothetical protein
MKGRRCGQRRASREGNQGFRIIFFAIPSATVRSESGMNGLLLQPGRDDEGLRLPVSHHVTGWAAISFSSRAASSSRVSPSNTRLLAFRMRLGCVFLTKLIKESPDVEGLDAKRALGGYRFRNDQPTLVRKREPKLGRLLADLCFGAHQKGGNVGDGAPVLDPVAKREQILFGPLFAVVEIRLFGHSIHPNSLALSLASLQAAVRKVASVIETRLSSFRGKLLARS